MEWKNLITIIGASQGLFFAIILLTSKKYFNQPNRLLAFATVLLTLINLRVSNLIEYPIFIELFEYLAIEFLFPPVLFLYVLRNLKEKLTITKSILLFTPFIIFSVIGSLISFADFRGFDFLAEKLERTEGIEIHAFAFLTIIVSFCSFSKTYYSNREIRFKRWIYSVFTVLLLLVCTIILAELSEHSLDFIYWHFIIMGISLFLVGVSYYGISQLNNERHYSEIKKTQPVPSKKNKELSRNHFSKIEALVVEKKLYQNPEVSRETIAQYLDLSVSTVSRVLRDNDINSLNDFVNHFRINRAKEMLVDYKYDIYSLEAIGKEVGFKSRSAFYSVFKKTTGLTPGSYKKKNNLVRHLTK